MIRTRTVDGVVMAEVPVDGWIPLSEVRLEHVAPTLAKGYRAQRAFLRKRRHDLYRAEKLVAHRELQLVRAQSTGQGRYIAVRYRKLESAREELRRARERR